MKIFRYLPKEKQRKPCALAVGNFDGIHCGHEYLLKKVCEAAQNLNVIPAVLTFYPHPRDFFVLQKGLPPTRTLTNLRDKLTTFAKAGIERVYLIKFDEDFALLSADVFTEKVLVDSLEVRQIVIGEDFHFGAGRSGTAYFLRESGKRYGFNVDVLKNIVSGGLRVSSSAVRDALARSDFTEAKSLLGRDYAISGHIIHGGKLGRQLGFPTLNVRMAQANPVLQGVFITRVHGLGKPIPSVSCIGSRPTVDLSGRQVLETHLLDFSESVYGKLVKVEFLKKLRDNQKFDSLDALKKAIANDVNQTREFFDI